jgi:homoserine O-acetyltransferase
LVNADYKLLKEYLGFDHILAALGPSIGGSKAYQFGVSYPGYVSGLIPIAGTPATNFLTKTVTKKLMAILELDSGWHGGNYETNPTWALETLQWHWISWLYTPQFFVTDLKTKEAYFKWQNMWQGIIRFYPQDARDVYYTIQAWAGHDVGDTPGFNGDVRAALQSIQAKVLIIGAKGDMFFTREESMFAKKAIPKATYVEIDNNWGHINCVGWEPGGAKIIDKAVSKFLSNLVAGVQ